MRTRCLLPLLGLVATTLSSCFAGPHQMRRSIDDWDARLYVESPWLNVGLWVVPVIPIAELAGSLVDFFVIDPMFFWGDDAWDGNGTGFKHASTDPDQWLDSVIRERGHWLRLEKHDDRPAKQ